MCGILKAFRGGWASGVAAFSIKQGRIMSAEEHVAAHYTPGMLESKILGALRSAGKNLDQLGTGDLAPVDDFHVGGRESTQALADFVELRPGMHLLDVGCGIGGPARYFAERGCQVTGVDLSDEFIQVAESLTRRLKLDHSTTFRLASALKLPFDSGTFDGAYEIHAGMNIPDKAGVFREVARVLKPGAQFAIFDILRTGNGAFNFPVPWAKSPETDFAAGLDDYAEALRTAGFRIEHQRGRRQFALEFMQKMAAQTASAPPALGLHLLMGEDAPVMLKNVAMAFASGALEPVELVAIVS
jgi:ubiquinone/menaquinone biosynthesis C-methylase UbiE